MGRWSSRVALRSVGQCEYGSEEGKVVQLTW